MFRFSSNVFFTILTVIMVSLLGLQQTTVVPSLTHILVPTKSTPVTTTIGCVQPPRDKDPATLTDAQRAYYGYPMRVHGKDFSEIDHLIFTKGKNVCIDPKKLTNFPPSTPTINATVANSCHTQLSPCDMEGFNWSGNIANDGAGDYTTNGIPPYPVAPNGLNPQGHIQETYSEADADWYVGCPAFGTNDAVAEFVGLGGLGNSGQNLVQAGVIIAQSGLGYEMYAFVQNTGYKPYALDMWGIAGDKAIDPCGPLLHPLHVFAQIKNGNCMQIFSYTTPPHNYSQCWGPAAANTSAEFIAERIHQSNLYSDPFNISAGDPPLSNFGVLSMRSCGVTINTSPTYGSGAYIGIKSTRHDYSTLLSQDQSHVLASVGPIYPISGENPPDSFDITWQAFN